MKLGKVSYSTLGALVLGSMFAGKYCFIEHSDSNPPRDVKTAQEPSGPVEER